MIVFTKEPEDTVLSAYNNVIFKFHSDSSSKPIKADVKADNFIMELPSFNGEFYINLKNVVTMLINKNNFNDDIELPHAGAFVFRDTSLYHEIEIHFNIILNNGQNESASKTLRLTKSVKQIVRDHVNKNVQRKLKFLLPYTDQTAYAAFWNQAPFDISLYSDQNRTVTIRNKRTFVSTQITINKGVNRIFFADGQFENGFQTKIPLLNNHVNELEFLIGNEIYVTLNLERKEFDCGSYLKWFNTDGGWSYWKFIPIEISTIQSKSDIKINRDFDNIENDTCNYTQTGRILTEKRELKSGMLTNEQQRIVQTILRSPRVFLFNKNPYQNHKLTDFKEVKVSDSSLSLNNKLNKKEFKIELDMPDQYAQTYAN